MLRRVGFALLTLCLIGSAVGQSAAQPVSSGSNTSRGLLETLALGALPWSQAGAAPLEQTPTGLVAAYGFDEGSGTTANDASGNNNNGTISGATWGATGKFGQALSFDGINDLVTVNDAPSLDLTTGLTIEAWVNPTSVSGWRTVALKARSDDLAYGLYASNGTVPQGQLATTGGTPRVRPSSALPLNTWTHVAFTFDGTNLRLFAGGALLASSTGSGTILTSADPLGIGGNTSWGEYFPGLIDEVRVYNRALSQAEIQTDINTPVGSIVGPPAETVPPTVNMTSPANNSTVSGTITVSADASDNVAVSYVQFLLDGNNLQAQDTAPPYSISVDTGSIPNGAHALSARAVDSSGNQATSSSVAVTVSNNNVNVGQWAPTAAWPSQAIHSVLQHTGEVLWTAGNREKYLWNPTSNTFTAVPLTNNLFCAGHVVLADGRSLIVGGTSATLGSNELNIFNPTTRTWTAGPSMAQGRWYPSTTLLGDGRVFINSGATTCTGTECIADIPEIYDPATNTLTRLTAAQLAMWYYPLQFLLPDGRLLVAGSNEDNYETRTLNLQTQTWTTIDSRLIDGGSAAMYRPGKIIKSGSAENGGLAGDAAATTFVLDMSSPAPAWRQTASMAFPRAYQQLTLLPDGNVLATAGGTQTDGENRAFGVLEAEMWSPATETWTTMAPMETPRLYHASALLLPDGRVLVGGGEEKGGINEYSADVYSPPYLFKGPRPTITSSPSTISYGSSFFVGTPDASRIASVALLKPGASTHQFDEDQRYVDLTFTQAAGGLTINAPAHGNLAPPGYYMLFLVSTDGVPSVAPFVQLPVSGAAAPTSTPTPGTPTSTSTPAPPTATFTPSTPTATSTRTPTPTPAPSNPTGLVAAYGFEEIGGTSATDASGSGNTGTINGATRVTTGRFGNALSFDGNDWVTINDASSLDLAAGMTLEAWVSPSTVAGWRTVLLKERPNGFAYVLYGSNGAVPEGDIRTTTGSQPGVRNSVSLPLNAWTHLALTFNGTNLRLYVNGALVATGGSASTIMTSDGFLRIGGNAVWGEYFIGRIDEVRVYNRALSQGEVQTNMNAPVGAGGPTSTPTPTLTPTPVAPTATSTSTSTPVPPTSTPTPTSTPDPAFPTSTPTATPEPAVATSTPTSTPVPPTSTSTPTATPIPPTSTSTPTATPIPPTSTATPVPPTSTSTPTSTPPPPSASGLVAAYGFEEIGGTSATDASGSSNTGIINGATRVVTGRFGNALSFDGNDWITITDAPSLDLSTGMTLEAWVNPTTVAGWRTLLLKERPGGFAYVLYGSNGAVPQGEIRTTTGSQSRVRNSVGLPLNTWTHVAVTFDGATLRLYVNGTLVATGGSAATIMASDGPLRIGGNAVWGEYFVGLIDEVRVYNRARSQVEVQTDMNTPVGP